MSAPLSSGQDFAIGDIVTWKICTDYTRREYRQGRGLVIGYQNNRTVCVICGNEVRLLYPWDLTVVSDRNAAPERWRNELWLQCTPHIDIAGYTQAEDHLIITYEQPHQPEIYNTPWPVALPLQWLAPLDLTESNVVQPGMNTGKEPCAPATEASGDCPRDEGSSPSVGS